VTDRRLATHRAALAFLQLPPRAPIALALRLRRGGSSSNSDRTAPLVAQATGTSMNKLRPPNKLRSPDDFAQRGVVAN